MKPLPLASAVLLLLPIAAASQKVDVRWQRGTDFAKYETYAWMDGRRAPDNLSHQRIVSAVENELAIKGWWREDQAPDLYLSYYASVVDEVTIEYAYRTDWYDDASVTVHRIHEGTLLLDMVDAAENELLWRGIVVRALTDNPRRNDSKINDTVRRMLGRFPP